MGTRHGLLLHVMGTVHGVRCGTCPSKMQRRVVQNRHMIDESTFYGRGFFGPRDTYAPPINFDRELRRTIQ